MTAGWKIKIGQSEIFADRNNECTPANLRNTKLGRIQNRCIYVIAGEGMVNLLTASKHLSERRCVKVAGNRERVLFYCLRTATNVLVKQRT